ncbi:MAG: hypothetical protein EXQ53_07735, partial [Acidobacteria bacterium]|nr:hypothetical protein [Acidobacteriota bacterium]
MTSEGATSSRDADRLTLAGVAAVSAALLMTELALTRIFSVTMYYHFAFLAISIALFGLSASGVFVYVMRGRLSSVGTRELLTWGALAHAVVTVVALACLVRIRVGLNYSPSNLALMLAIYALAALPFLTGGAVISLTFARLTDRINVVYAADLLGAAGGCLALIPLLNQLGAPGVVLTAAALSMGAAVCFAPRARRPQVSAVVVALFSLPAGVQAQRIGIIAPGGGGHQSDRVIRSQAGRNIDRTRRPSPEPRAFLGAGHEER